MAVITIVGSGMMGSAIGIPAAENGNEVRLVGTPLDREIIDHARSTGMHLTMKQKLPEWKRNSFNWAATGSAAAEPAWLARKCKTAVAPLTMISSTASSLKCWMPMPVFWGLRPILRM